jgi:hypothetical protein
MMTTRKGRRLLSGKQTVFSIRDTGYKSTDYAVAELIDNSLQAKSDTVLIVLITDRKTGGQRAVDHVTEILVIDDGDGMDEQLLFDCLAFGESGRLMTGPASDGSGWASPRPACRRAAGSTCGRSKTPGQRKLAMCTSISTRSKSRAAPNSRC